MKRFDIFGSQIQFRFQSQKSYTTALGFFFTIAIACVVILRLIILLNDIYVRADPTVLQKERQVDSPEKFIMNNYTLPFAFGLQDGVTQNHYIDPSIYNVVAFQLTKYQTQDEFGQPQVQFKQTNATVQQCSKDNFQNPKTQDKFLALPYNNLYCLDPQFEEEIEGDYSEPDFQYFVIQIYPCNGQGCGNTKSLSKSFFAIYFQDVIISPDNKDEPFKFYNRDLFWITSTSSPREITMYFRNNYIESDFGWVTSDIQTKRHISFSNQDVSFISDTQYFVQLVLRFEKQKENVYQRKYKNLTNVVSEIGGFTQSMLAIGFILCTTLSDLMLSKSILKQAFNFKKSKKDNPYRQTFQTQKNIQKNLNSNKQVRYKNNIEKSNYKADVSQTYEVERKDYQDNLKKKKSEVKYDATRSNFQNQTNIDNSQIPLTFQKDLNQFKKQNSLALLSTIIKKKSAVFEPEKQAQNEHKSVMQDDNGEKTIELNNQNQKNQPEINNEQFKKLLSQETSSMELSIIDYIKYFFWPFGEIKKKKKIIDYSIQKLYYHLDVIYIVNKLLEVDKLKQLIMDHDQIQLFEYISKPVIYEDDIFQQQNELNQSEQQQEKYNILYQDKRSEIEKIQDAYKSYQSLTNRQNLSALDKKILNHLDPQLLNLFNYKEEKIPNHNEYLENSKIVNINQNSLNSPLNQNEIQKQSIHNNALQNVKPGINLIQINSPRSENLSNFYENVNFDEQIPIEGNQVSSANQYDTLTPQNIHKFQQSLITKTKF